jgi:hypothetical protein
MWMAEVDHFCRKVIQELTGKKPRGIRPMRAGDYSFNPIGLTSMYMLMSTIPERVKREKGFYTVGGCAGNSWAWHTENDTLEVADPEVLLRDIQVYVASILRMANAYIFPFDFSHWAKESRKVLQKYQAIATDLFDLKPAIGEIKALQKAFSDFYSGIEKSISGKRKKPDRYRQINQQLLDLGRILIPIDYTKSARFSHDPAVPIPPFPDLEPVRQLPSLSQTKDEFRFLRAQLVRGRNKVVDAFRRARRRVEEF